MTLKGVTKAAERVARSERERLERKGERGMYVGLLNFAESAAKMTREILQTKEDDVNRKCRECFCEVKCTQGLICPSTAQHFICRQCFSREVHEQLSPVAQDRFVARGAKVVCSVCLPTVVAFSDGALARGLIDDDFALYRRAESEAAAARQGQGPERSGQGEARAQPAECAVCFADMAREDRVECPGPARHLVCRQCFSREVREQLSHEARGRFSAAGARVVCRLCRPAAVALADGALARRVGRGAGGR